MAKNIYSTPLNIPITIVDEYFNTNDMVYDEFYATNCDITFTNIDQTLKVFEGYMDINFSPRITGVDPLTGVYIYDEYPVGTNTNFSARIDYFKFTAE